MKTMLGVPSVPPAGPSAPPPDASAGVSDHAHSPDAVARRPESGVPEGPRNPVPKQLARTMLGIAPTAATPDAAAPRPSNHPTFAQGTPATVLSSPPDAPEPEASGTARFKQTMLGGVEAAAVPQRAATAIGVGAGFASQAAPHASTAFAGGATPGTPQAPGVPFEKRTILGVARPGIAPLNPGVAKEPPLEAGPQELQSEGNYGLPPKRSLLLVAGLLLLSAGVLGGMFLWWSAGRAPELLVTPRLSSEGFEVLSVQCLRCPNDSLLLVGKQEASFTGGVATVRPPTPLSVGENMMTFRIRSPDSDVTTVDAIVPLRYRVTPRLTRLSESPPKVEVELEAAEPKAVVIDGKELKLSGRLASLAIDVSPELTGQAPDKRAFQKKVPYTITFEDGSKAESEVSFQLAIVPLRIESPGEALTIDTGTFRLAGHTEPSARLFVGASPVPVKADGSFDQTMRISAPGESTFIVRATKTGDAPRLVPLKVKRVPSLKAEAAKLEAASLTSYDDVQSNPNGVQKPIAFKGRVVEARRIRSAWVILMDVTSGCSTAPCLARIAFGGEGAFKNGQALSMFGTLKGTVEGPRSGTIIPEISAQLIL